MVSGNSSSAKDKKDNTPDIKTPPGQDKTKDTIKEKLFDINIDIVKDKIFLGEKLMLIAKLINVGVPGAINATIHYIILDNSNVPVYDSVQVVRVETQKEFTDSVDTSKLPIGNYRLMANLTYESQTEPAESEGMFSVVAKMSPVQEAFSNIGQWFQAVFQAIGDFFRNIFG